MKHAVLWFLFVFCLDLLCFVNALNTSDEGVCVVKVSAPKTRIKYYTAYINKKCGKKKCTVKKSKKETYTVHTNHTVCCNGWEYFSNEDKCVPHCSTGCIGRCIAPDVCVVCHPPAYVNHNNTCVSPVCDPPCVNGDCHQNNTCQCHSNFIMFNSTLCHRGCDESFQYNFKSDSCDPVCNNCTNGECIAPNVCTCYEGYELKDNVCEPTCDDCDNGNCIGVNMCVCLEGYIKENGTCIAECDSCDNGYCAVPNQCQCREGFSKIEGVCRPYCPEGCANGVCSAPGVCTCDEGFQKDDSRPSVCFKPCNRCVSCNPQGECVQADDCEDKNNGRKILGCCSGWFYDKGSCKAICRLGCEGGQCIAPDRCHCVPPLILATNQTTQSCVLPHCDDGCPNGVCVADNNCTCNHGYKKQSDICQPVCNQECVNGFCSAPDTCTCNAGYKMSKENSTSFCTPTCEPSCVNSTCTSPNTCTCKSGYEASDIPSECKPHCGDCQNGDCVGPNNCQCNMGFELDNDTCISMRPVECTFCNSNCTESPCWCSDGRPCYFVPVVNEVANPPRNMATLTWVFGVTMCVLFVSLVVVIQWTWRRQKNDKRKTANNGESLYNSVVYTVPNTLVRSSMPGAPRGPADEERPRDSEISDDQWTKERMLPIDGALNDVD